MKNPTQSRIECTCPTCAKPSFAPKFYKNFTWDCPHCGALNLFDNGQSFDFEEKMQAQYEEYYRSKGK